MSAPRLPKVFIGSSSEALDVSKYLADELKADVRCEPATWSQGVFEASSYTLEALANSAMATDFAVLVVTPDDLVESRSETQAAPRDNVIFELGLFIGALGRERTYIVAEDTGASLRLPTDLQGITQLRFTRHSDGNLKAALNGPALRIAERIQRLGVRVSAVPTASDESERDALGREIGLICDNARAQGWVVKTQSLTTLRLNSPRGKRHTLSLGRPDESRVALRKFVRELRADGLRVNRSVREAALLHG